MQCTLDVSSNIFLFEIKICKTQPQPKLGIAGFYFLYFPISEYKLFIGVWQKQFYSLFEHPNTGFLDGNFVETDCFNISIQIKFKIGKPKNLDKKIARCTTGAKAVQVVINILKI